MPHNIPLISVVVTVYNKAAYLPATIDSLVYQEGDLEVEYIFVDDVSTDDSLAAIEQHTKGMPNVVVIKNSENQGPSIRVNQGARLARGQYLFCFDSDDILAKNALLVMSDALQQHDADVVYGNWQKTEETGAALLGRRMAEHPKIDVSEDALYTVLTGRFLRMQFMVKRALFLTAGGADECVFIQDESIPLRLAVHARRWLKIHDTVMYVPHVEGALSRNISQLNHDRFFAHYHLLQDYPKLPPSVQQLVYRRAVSAGWKQIRFEKKIFAIAHWVFRAYLKSLKPDIGVNHHMLEHIAEHMKNLSDVRRTNAF